MGVHKAKTLNIPRQPKSTLSFFLSLLSFIILMTLKLKMLQN